MSTIIFMPIKLNNERLQGKNIKQFDDGTPLFQVPLKTAIKAKEMGYVDNVVVFCSDDIIKDYLPDGVKLVKRSPALDSQSTRCADIIEEFLKIKTYDIYVMFHATSPFITKNHLISCIDAVKNRGYDSAFAVKKFQNFFWYENKPLNFSLDYAPRTQDMKPYYCELSSPYVFTRSVFEKYHGRTGINPFMCECSEIEAIDIDDYEDFEIANAVYMNIIKHN